MASSLVGRRRTSQERPCHHATLQEHVNHAQEVLLARLSSSDFSWDERSLRSKVALSIGPLTGFRNGPIRPFNGYLVTEGTIWGLAQGLARQLAE